MRQAILAFLLSIGLTGAKAAEPPGTLDRSCEEIHVPAGFRQEQIPELLRQLRLSAFIDLGPAWLDYPDSTQDFSKPAVPVFDAKKSTVRAALDAYCSTREMVWEPGPGPDTIVILHKLAEVRRSGKVLEAPFKSAPSFAGESETERLESVAVAWKESVQAVPLQIDAAQRLRNDALPAAPNSKNMREVVNQWLVSAPQLTIWLKEFPRENQPSSTQLEIASTPLDLDKASLETLLACLTNKEAAAKFGSANPNAARRFCVQEFYRRWRIAPEDAKAAFLKAAEPLCAEWFSKGSNLKYEMMDTSRACYGSLVFAVFDVVPKETKFKLLSARLLSTPEQFGAEWLPYWKKLQSSDIPEIKERADGEVEAFKESQK